MGILHLKTGTKIYDYGFINAIQGVLSPKRMGAVIVAFFAATCITRTGNMALYANWQIVLAWIIHANEYLSMNSTVNLVLEIALHGLVIYQTYVLWIKRNNAIDIGSADEKRV